LTRPKLKISEATKPVEVCQSDAFGQRFDEACCAATAAAPSRAERLRVRRDCKNHNDDADRSGVFEFDVNDGDD
jgi:hypothetical protein